MIPLFLVFFLSSPSAETHSLQYFYTAVRGVNYPEFTAVGLVDGEQILYYDNNRILNLKTEWMKKDNTTDADYWDTETPRMQHDENDFKVLLTAIMEKFNHTKGVHTLQNMYGCELDDDDTIRGYEQYGYDGEDFLSLDLETETWIAANHHAVALQDRYRWYNGYKHHMKDYLENICISWLKKFVSYGRETLERKDPPEASVFHKNFPQPELVCHATGFFHKEINITWLKDGEKMNVNPNDTLPNHDGTFQKRAVLRVSPEELKEHEYTCVVQHSSLEKDLVLKAPDVDVGGVPLGIIVGAVVVVLALIALIVAAVLIYKKKKNSGFKPVPAKFDSSSVDSSNCS